MYSHFFLRTRKIFEKKNIYIFDMFLGKSNIMEAISFVMGEKINSLRVHRLNDLISQKPDGTLMTHRCST